MDSPMASASLVVGLDLVQVSAIAASVAQFGERFLARLYTPDELRHCLVDEGSSALRLAARFAAKEAVRKVLGAGHEGLGWRSIEVVRAEDGACAVLLHREAHTRAIDMGFTGFSLSMTHEADYASAVVVGERGATGRTA
jgi:holo-[acyl-carrier protein] synthase